MQQGTYLGTLEHVNHLDLVGWINTARYKWAELMGNKINFKPATFYLGIMDHLAKTVEGLDADAGEGGDRRGAKRGHGEILDSVPHGVATRREEGIATGVHPTKAPSSKQPNAKGNGESADPGFSSGPNRYCGATNVSLSTTLEVTTSTHSTHKPGSFVYPPRQHTPESKFKDSRPIPTRQTKPRNDD